MKKILLSVVAAASALTAFAQADSTSAQSASLKYKAEPNRFGVEAGVSLENGFSFKDDKDYDNGFKGGRINAIYSLTENWAVRCGFGLEIKKTYTHNDNFIKDTYEGVEYEAENDNKKVTVDSKFDILPGIVYSFKGTERLEPYIGAELVFGFDKSRERTNEEHSGYKGDSDREAKEKLNYTASKKTVTTNNLHFGANGFTGFNFYLCKDLFIGAELNFGFVTTPNAIDDKVKVEDTRGVEEEKESKDKNFSHNTDINLLFSPSIRLGWKF